MNWCEAPGYLLGNEALIKYGCRMASGFWLTLFLVGISVPLGFVLGLGLAVARSSQNPLIRGLSKAYVTFFRGTPLLVQLFLFYYGSGQLLVGYKAALQASGTWLFTGGFWSLLIEGWFWALVAFTLNTAAYQAEALRGAIQSLPKGQVEAGKALGMSRGPIFWKIVFPQALIVALRPLGNELIVMIKASAVASLVTVLDLMGQTRIAFARSFDFTVYAMAALVYLMLTETVRRIWNRLEAYLSRHLHHRASARQQDVAPGETVRV
jgi:polar amino acid transport system permease protein